MNNKLYYVKAQTQRRYLIAGSYFLPADKDEAKLTVFKYILQHKKELNYNDKLYIKIEISENMEE